MTRGVAVRMLALGVDGVIRDRPDLRIEMVRDGGRAVLRPGTAAGRPGEEPWR